MPAMAPSTCSQTPSRWQMSAMAGTGSKASEEVVPAVATTMQGTLPAARSSSMAAANASGRMANDSSTATRCRFWLPSPAIRTPFSTAECVSLVA